MDKWPPGDASRSPYEATAPTAIAAMRHSIEIGGVDLSRALHSFTLREENRLHVAEVRLRVSDLAKFDYFATLAIGNRVEGSEETLHFGGTIEEARQEGDDLVLSAFAASELKETPAAPWVTANVPPLDLIYMLARTSGFAADQIQVELPDPLPLETIEVVQPVLGCTVTVPVSIDERVRLLPASMVDLQRFELSDALQQLKVEFNRGLALAVTYVTGKRGLFEAEEIGKSRIARASSWLTTQLRFGSAFGLDGGLRDFSREQSRATIRPADVVMVTGLSTSRSWLRDTTTPPAVVTWDAGRITDLGGLVPEMDARAESSYRALARAANGDLAAGDRLAATWEALEYYAATVSTPSLFTKSEIKAVRKRAIEGLSLAQVGRIDFALSQLNSDALLKRVFFQAEVDGAWISPSDKELLRRMREYRNDNVHGRAVRAPSRGELEWFVSLVARLLIFWTGSVQDTNTSPSAR